MNEWKIQEWKWKYLTEKKIMNRNPKNTNIFFYFTQEQVGGEFVNGKNTD